jgi:sensor histidine kinase YesM
VENAIKHGVEPRETGGQVDVEIRRQNDQLVIDVSDNGHGAASTAGAWPEGVGLRNTRRRLRAMYGGGQELVVHPRPDGGVRISIVLPYVAPAIAPRRATTGRPREQRLQPSAR